MTQSIKNKIKQLEKQNRLLTNNLLDAVWVMNADTLVYEYITPSICKISGFTPEEIIGRPITDRLMPHSLDKVSKILLEELKKYNRGKRTTKSLDLELIHKNGETYWVEIRAKISEDRGDKLKIIGITRDITAKKKADQRKDRLNKDLATALEERNMLLKENKILRKLLPTCSGCKRIRDDTGKWWPLDAYIREHTNSDFTHTICKDCQDVFYSECA